MRTNFLKYYKTVIPTLFIMFFLPSLCTAGLPAGTWTIHTESIKIYNVVVSDSVAWLNGIEYIDDGSQQSGLFRYNLLNNTHEFFPDKAYRNYLVKNSIALDSEGRLITFYIDAFPDGPCTIYRYDNESWETLYGPLGYHNIITNIFTDFNGGIWGIYVAPHSNDRIIRIDGNTGDHIFLDWAYFWAGFVSRYSPNTVYLSVTGSDLFSADSPSSRESDWTFHDNPFENQYIDIITVDQSGNVWFGDDGRLEFTIPYGVVRYDGTNWVIFTKNENGLASDTISALNADLKGNLWVGTPEGLSIYDGAVWETYTTRNSEIPYNDIRDIFVAEDGVIWVGFGGGLVSFTYEEPNAVRDNIKPNVFGLFENYPNPFNPATTIEYCLQGDSHVILNIYNVSGQLVKILKDEYQQAGNYSVTWDAKGFPSGLYFCTLKANEFTYTNKMLLIK